ncbi:type II toxin-antitoxin system PemK/MazF family toxin [Enterococcus faecalis]|uniref:type II toxin-antitoxin system PemK/MazF family toxin n=1 Tax=Enterococcus faecalis TaxID=1351 RepID=UPI001E5A4998|nr:type II toxin-antitoxin system PemK/MazF family toxin [Enterococcus faecalis]MCD5032908.1 type II toxin-antitoxin system PemK/MazF family toxin [Enterococcus faecalis]
MLNKEYTENEYQDHRNFMKGDIFMIEFQQDGQYTMSGSHRGVVLYDCVFPRNTVIVAPITSLYNGSGVRKKTISTDVILPESEDYLTKESIIKMEQLTCVDRKALGKKMGTLSPEFVLESSVAIVEVLQLESYIEAIVEHRLSQYIEALEQEGSA